LFAQSGNNQLFYAISNSTWKLWWKLYRWRAPGPLRGASPNQRLMRSLF